MLFLAVGSRTGGVFGVFGFRLSIGLWVSGMRETERAAMVQHQRQRCQRWKDQRVEGVEEVEVIEKIGKIEESNTRKD